MNIITYNSKTNIYGNRLNLVINHDTKEFYFSGCNAFNKGTIYNEQLQRDIKRIMNYYKNEENYTQVEHIIARDWR